METDTEAVLNILPGGYKSVCGQLLRVYLAQFVPAHRARYSHEAQQMCSCNQKMSEMGLLRLCSVMQLSLSSSHGSVGNSWRPVSSYHTMVSFFLKYRIFSNTPELKGIRFCLFAMSRSQEFMSLILSCLKNNHSTACASVGQAGALIPDPGLPHHHCLVGHETGSWIRLSAVWGRSREPSWLVFLFTLHTADFKYISDNCPLQQLSDDSACRPHQGWGWHRDSTENWPRTLWTGATRSASRLMQRAVSGFPQMQSLVNIQRMDIETLTSTWVLNNKLLRLRSFGPFLTLAKLLFPVENGSHPAGHCESTGELLQRQAAEP